MGYLGKVLIGGSLGVLAVAAVPFTGGGSLFGAATIAASLTGVSNEYPLKIHLLLLLTMHTESYHISLYLH